MRLECRWLMLVVLLQQKCVFSPHSKLKFLVKSAEERLKPWTPAADQAPGAETLMGIRGEVFSFFFKRGPVIYILYYIYISNVFICLKTGISAAQKVMHHA